MLPTRGQQTCLFLSKYLLDWPRPEPAYGIKRNPPADGSPFRVTEEQPHGFFSLLIIINNAFHACRFKLIPQLLLLKRRQ